MNAEERKQIRAWIEEEGELLKAEDVEEEFSIDWGNLHSIQEGILDRLTGEIRNLGY
jgi:hypothetical protein